MSISRQECLSRMLDSFSLSYDIYQEPDASWHQLMAAAAFFHSRDEKYVLVKRAQLWAVENHDYAFFFSLARLDGALWEDIYNFTVAAGLRQIHPHREHMCSYISLIILADEVDSALVQIIHRSRFEKSFRCSWHGWASLRVAVMDFTANAVVCNRCPSDFRQLMERFYHQ